MQHVTKDQTLTESPNETTFVRDTTSDSQKDSDDTLLDSENVSWLDNKDKKRSIFSTFMFRTKKSKKISPTPNQRVRVEVSGEHALNFRLKLQIAFPKSLPAV